MDSVKMPRRIDGDGEKSLNEQSLGWGFRLTDATEQMQKADGIIRSCFS